MEQTFSLLVQPTKDSNDLGKVQELFCICGVWLTKMETKRVNHVKLFRREVFMVQINQRGNGVKIDSNFTTTLSWKKNLI